MLQEGIQPVLIEHAARLAGMPVGPLALADEVSLSLISQILKQTREDLGSAYEPHPAEVVVERFVQLKRLGKKVGKGFYEYPESGKKALWSELSKLYPVASEQPDLKLLQYRLLFIQSLEAVRCMEERIITDPSDADLGSILGLGFPPFTGGVISYLKRLGHAKSLEICEQLEKKWGKRFHAPPSLVF
jgi:3-hydroxyacyl-CoA dehydrogenase/enoyl-CoA hydratase/3-hydroxybutyryl-CoA epimerase